MLILPVLDKQLEFEHSLVSISAWEAEFEKPFFSDSEQHVKSNDEMLRYFHHMLVRPRKHADLLEYLDSDQITEIVEYITKGSTATTVKEIKTQTKTPAKKLVTSELIYYWMVALRIPFSPTDTWHINRTLMLVKVTSIEQEPPKKSKQGQAERVKNMRELNAQRRKEANSSG